MGHMVGSTKNFGLTIYPRNQLRLEENGIWYVLWAGCQWKAVHRDVAKHGKAKQVLTPLVRTPDQVELTIVDNVQGFDVQQISSGFGLTSIRERATSIHASLQVKTRPGMGTRVKLIWKLKR